MRGSSTSSWEEWQLEYRYGALYVFPPDEVIGPIDELRARHDPRSAAICQAHISLSEPLPRPATDADRRELEDALARLDPFVIRYGPLRSLPGHPGVVYAISPEDTLRDLRRVVHGTSLFIGVELRREHVAPHMTIAEFISLARTHELLDELQGTVPTILGSGATQAGDGVRATQAGDCVRATQAGEFQCDRVEYAAPDADFFFHRRWRIPLGGRMA